MSDLAAGIICPHCGDRYKLETAKNSSGDTVQRGVCSRVGGAQLWSTGWSLVRRSAS